MSQSNWVGRRIRLASVGLAATLLIASTIAMGAGGASSNSLDKSPLSTSLLVARGLRAGTFHFAPGSGSVSRPGVPNVTILPNVRASGNGSDISNENPIAANPSNPLQLLSGGNDYNCSARLGFYSSDDGGGSWRSHCMPVVGAGGCGDPNVAYDTTGASYILGIGDCNGISGSIVLQKSTDNGLTWGMAHKVINPLFRPGSTDKPWTEVDHSATSPFKDRIYTSITQFDASSNSAISVSYSTNGGNTFATKQVGPKQSFPTSVDTASDLAVAANGTVYLTWIRCPWSSGPNGDCGDTTSKLLMSKSTDGGVTWSRETQIGTAQLAPDTGGCAYGCFPGTIERLSTFR